MNNDSEEGELPEEIGEAAIDGDFERVKAWLAGGSASDPRSVNAGDDTGWRLLHWTVVGELTPERVEFARYLISQSSREVASSSPLARDAGARRAAVRPGRRAPSSSSSARGTTASSGTSLVSGARRPKTLS